MALPCNVQAERTLVRMEKALGGAGVAAPPARPPDAATGVVAQALGAVPGGGGVSAELRGCCCCALPDTGFAPDLDPVPGLRAAGSRAWRLALGVGNSILSGRLLRRGQSWRSRFLCKSEKEDVKGGR